MNGIWNQRANKISFPVSQGDASTDVLIIGGGMAGILCAYHLQNSGVDCMVAEAGEILGGVTQNTTAKITFQHGLIYDKLIKTYGTEYAKMYFEANREAAESYRSLCECTRCDYTVRDSLVYCLNGTERLEKELTAYEKLGIKASFTKNTELPFDVSGALKIHGQASFNPLAFAYTLAEKLNIREHTRVIEIFPDHVKTNRGKIRAEKIISATHFPFINKHGLYFLKLYQHRSYVIALKNAPVIDGMYIDGQENGLSFRNYGNLLLLGGGGHRTGKQGGGWKELAEFALKYFPCSRMVSRWATQDCMTLDGIPYIGQYSPNTPNMYVATGFNKWGMTSAMAAAKILTDIITGRENPYAAVFSPDRSVFHLQLAKNAFSSVLGLLTPTAPRCPHLGCALKYNKQEHSWDCSCHGSRFSEEGKLLNSPAQNDLSKKP